MATSATTSLVIQPKFAGQLYRQQTMAGAAANNPPLQHGYMIWDQPMTSIYKSSGGGGGNGRDLINFMFNPSTVNTDYNVGSVALQAAYLYPVPGDNGNIAAPLLQQTVSFQLYFDRTFELAYGTGATGLVNDPTIYGVQADVYQFMQFTGLLASAGSTSSALASTPVTNAGTVASNIGAQTAVVSANSQGIMMMVPCWVFFGNPMNANAQQMTPGAGGYAATYTTAPLQLAFFGYIAEWSVQYTHWTTNMVPIRCVISVSFTMLPTSDSQQENAVWSQGSQINTTTYMSTP